VSLALTNNPGDAMPTTPRQKPATRQEQETAAQRNSAIARYVLDALGQPADLLRVEVRELWEGHYRVNVLVGTDAASVRVAHSYFLVADAQGNVVSSTPALPRGR
jgi:hypothetical protein